MNKEDTFSLLKRIPYEQLMKEWDSDIIRTEEDRNKWLKDRGWTYREFLTEWRKRNPRYGRK